MTNSEDFIQSRLSNELEHHGVKGMRWGHRKQRPDFSDGSHLKDIDSQKKRHKELQKQYNLPDIDWSKSFTTDPKRVANSRAARKYNEANRKSFEKDRYKTPFKRNLSKIKLSDISKLRPLTEGIQSGYQIARYLG